MTPTPPLTHDECGPVLRLVAEPSRMRLLGALRSGPRSVGELEGALGLRQYQVSRHLAVLLHAGLVEREPHGRRVVYRLADSLRSDFEVALDLGCCRLSVR